MLHTSSTRRRAATGEIFAQKENGLANTLLRPESVKFHICCLMKEDFSEIENKIREILAPPVVNIRYFSVDAPKVSLRELNVSDQM